MFCLMPVGCTCPSCSSLGGVQPELQQTAREEKSFFDVSSARFQYSKMAEVSGLRGRNHFEPNCKSRVVDDGKQLVFFCRVDV